MAQSPRYSKLLRLIANGGLQPDLGRALFKGAQLVQQTAQRSITAGAVSGKNHVPSRPGEPPNEDTGVLRSNIEATLEEPTRARVASKAEYAAPLELGTSTMAARPYMGPAARAKRNDVHKLVRKAVDRAIRREASKV